MRARLSVLLLLVSAVHLGDVGRSPLVIRHPKPESAVLKNYTPQHVCERFQEKRVLLPRAGRAAEQAKILSPHQASSTGFSPSAPTILLPLMTALNDDLSRSLT